MLLLCLPLAPTCGATVTSCWQGSSQIADLNAGDLQVQLAGRVDVDNEVSKRNIVFTLFNFLRWYMCMADMAALCGQCLLPFGRKLIPEESSVKLPEFRPPSAGPSSSLVGA